ENVGQDHTDAFAADARVNELPERLIVEAGWLPILKRLGLRGRLRWARHPRRCPCAYPVFGRAALAEKRSWEGYQAQDQSRNRGSSHSHCSSSSHMPTTEMLI